MPYLKRINSLPLINHISYKYAQVSDIGPSWSSCSTPNNASSRDNIKNNQLIILYRSAQDSFLSHRCALFRRWLCGKAANGLERILCRVLVKMIPRKRCEIPVNKSINQAINEIDLLLGAKINPTSKK